MQIKQIIGKSHEDVNLSKKMKVLDVINLLKKKDKIYIKAFANLKTQNVPLIANILVLQKRLLIKMK